MFKKAPALGLALAGIGLALGPSGAAAEPLADLQACDVYGFGYYSTPGGLCFSMGGFLRGEAEFLRDGTDRLTLIARPTLDVRTETAHGTLRGFFALKLEADSPSGTSAGDTTSSTERSEAYVSLDPVLVGWTTSTFDYARTYTYIKGVQSDATTLQARFTGLWGGYTVSVAVEDPHGRDLGTSLPSAVVSLAPTATWGFMGSAAVADTPFGLGVGAQVGVEVPVAINASVRAVGAVAHNAPTYVGLGGTAPGFAWSATLSGRFALLPGLNLVAGASVAGGQASPVVWQVVGGVHWAPVALGRKLEVGTEVFHRQSDGSGDDGLLLRGQYNF